MSITERLPGYQHRKSDRLAFQMLSPQRFRTLAEGYARKGAKALKSNRSFDDFVSKIRNLLPFLDAKYLLIRAQQLANILIDAEDADHTVGNDENSIVKKYNELKLKDWKTSILLARVILACYHKCDELGTQIREEHERENRSLGQGHPADILKTRAVEKFCEITGEHDRKKWARVRANGERISCLEEEFGAGVVAILPLYEMSAKAVLGERFDTIDHNYAWKGIRDALRLQPEVRDFVRLLSRAVGDILLQRIEHGTGNMAEVLQSIDDLAESVSPFPPQSLSFENAHGKPQVAISLQCGSPDISVTIGAHDKFRIYPSSLEDLAPGQVLNEELMLCLIAMHAPSDGIRWKILSDEDFVSAVDEEQAEFSSANKDVDAWVILHILTAGNRVKERHYVPVVIKRVDRLIEGKTVSFKATIFNPKSDNEVRRAIEHRMSIWFPKGSYHMIEQASLTSVSEPNQGIFAIRHAVAYMREGHPDADLDDEMCDSLRVGYSYWLSDAITQAKMEHWAAYSASDNDAEDET